MIVGSHPVKRSLRRREIGGRVACKAFPEFWPGKNLGKKIKASLILKSNAVWQKWAVINANVCPSRPELYHRIEKTRIVVGL